MYFIYNVFVYIAYGLICFLSLFNHKLRLFVNGRKGTFKKLSLIQSKDKTIWFHVASLGEFEQARPIIERLNPDYPNHKIIITFFSPSGYEIQKNYELADVVCYLPFDSKKNVRKFIQQIHPELAIIIKYEFWPNLLSQIGKTNTKTLLVSGVFRKNQLFFKSYGKWMAKFLANFNHFFVQGKTSEKLLNSINLHNVTVSGDTRFDRVCNILQQDSSLDFIEEFKNNTYTVVAGSTWREDEALIVDYINKYSSDNEKFIIAPHTMNSKKIESLRNCILKKTILFTEKDNLNLNEYQVFIINTIGLLTKIYSYANVAYVGGGLATGLHNILEPAAYGIPVIFGANNYEKFNEANDLIKLGGSKTVRTNKDFYDIFTTLKTTPDLRIRMGKIAYTYIQNNAGATQAVISYIKKTIQSS